MSAPVYIFNESFSFWPLAKSVVKKFLGKNFSGPSAVEQSLIRGLKNLRTPYVLNTIPQSPIDAVCVLSGVSTLKWAIDQKKQGKIGKIIAGPNIAMPLDAGGIIFNENINIFLAPSNWVVEFCESFKPGFKNRVRVWAAGVETLAVGPAALRQDCLVYKKDADEKTFNSAIGFLKEKNINYHIINYGNYRREEYLTKLAGAKFMVYFAGSESQGLALNEAWMMNVPTLIYNGGYLNKPPYEFVASSSAPYLTPACGLFFSSSADFPGKLEQFINNLGTYQPRQYHLQNFTDQICVKKFLQILEEIE